MILIFHIQRKYGIAFKNMKLDFESCQCHVLVIVSLSQIIQTFLACVLKYKTQAISFLKSKCTISICIHFFYYVYEEEKALEVLAHLAFL